MTEALYTWMQNLACYFILLSAVMNFLPDNSYKKYIQFYMGLLLLLVILSPVFRFTSIQEEIDGYVREFQEEEGERQEWEEKAKNWEKEWKEKAKAAQGGEAVP